MCRGKGNEGNPILKYITLVLTVNLQYATIVGSSLGGIDSFKGIPYTQPPAWPIRLKPPQPITTNLGTVMATGVPRPCPQFLTSTNSSLLPVDVITELTDKGVFRTVLDSEKDCLTVNVQFPSTAAAVSSLPVIYWMFQGAFEFGSTQTYDVSELISTSVARGKDTIYILKDDSANIDDITKFGGDSSKVTTWEESAGSISAFNQMALYNGDNTTTSVARAFDYQSVALSYLPRPDGSVLTQSPDILALNGQFASAPFIIGDQGSEGTLFFLVHSHISTTDDAVQYLSTVFFHDATVEQVQTLVTAYSDDPSAGPPYNTSAAALSTNSNPSTNASPSTSPRRSSLTLTRRVFLNIASSVHPSSPLWPYLESCDYCTPILGIFHASEILTTYGITPRCATASIQNYYISFFN
ncbi:Alpha/Beta hydrolase protein [Hyaloscypha finlandica]|nr:Alpha/Beta hydrolase protein [Hyaloscypha finlandica]KAH8817996.1 Alpha/Beta hydrolase protein [Hyaloscypha sp. PMI_1271]